MNLDWFLSSFEAKKHIKIKENPVLNPKNFLACGGPSYHPVTITVSLYVQILATVGSPYIYPAKRLRAEEMLSYPIVFVRSRNSFANGRRDRRGNFRVRIDAAPKPFCESDTCYYCR